MKSLLESRKALSKEALYVLIIIVSVIIALTAGLMNYISPQIGPHLDLQASPPGYPEIGASWGLLVFKVNLSEVHPAYVYAENATVVVDVLTKTNKAEIYILLTDDEGRASFQYLEKHSEVCFQAHLEGYAASNRIILNQRYGPPGTLTWLSTFSIGSLGLTLGGAKYLSGKKKSSLRKIMNWTFLLIMSISSFLLIFTIYSFLFKGTCWGFPSEIIAPVVTFESLKYSASATVLLYIFAAFLLYLDQTKPTEDHKAVKSHKKKPKRKASTKAKN